PLSNQLEILYDQVCRITEEKDADYAARYDEYTVDRTKKFPKELFMTTIDYPFENTSMPVIIGYDRMLKARFGDSYIVPRQEKGLHDYPYYRKQLFDDRYHREELERIDECDIPDADLTKKVGQTVILYHTSVKEMLINCDKAIEKIKKTIALFEEDRDDIVFVWLPDIFLKNDDIAMDMVAPELVAKYEEILKNYIENKGITFRIDKTDNDILSSCDLYYGDEGIYADLFRQNNKEVIIQDYSVSGVQIAERFGIAEEKAQKEEFNEKENREDQIKPEHDIPEEWKKAIYKEDGNPKKVLLYYTSISVLYEYRDCILEKIRKVLDSLRNENNNIFLIWRPEPLADDLRSVFDKDFLNDYEALMEGFEAEGWGIIDKSSDDSAALKAADALYGDSDALILKAIEMGKPVMLQNPQL
ncbi:MAG: hypothetical protein K5894_13090, partial [Lachnospiraceae bacterium]|nr:hypothetical protein [Lachnospiraceae bacterium]